MQVLADHLPIMEDQTYEIDQGHERPRFTIHTVSNIRSILVGDKLV